MSTIFIVQPASSQGDLKKFLHFQRIMIQYCHTKRKKTDRPPKRYAYADMIAYTLSVIESIEILEPFTYKESEAAE